ncbi:MAG: hypothetical protein JWQ73_3912 [Variovorax sp.]|jgi:CMD domain protein|nr:hypothetical protein [Variovorax sp.]
MTATTIPDVIDHLLGIQPRDALDAIRAHRPQARLNAQQSYLALFEPAATATPSEVKFTLAERFAVAAFVTGLHGPNALNAFYADGLSRQDAPPSLLKAVSAEAAANAVNSGVPGPYGSFPAGPLSAEDQPGPRYAAGEAHRAVFSARLSAALAHAHLLVFHPRDAKAANLQALLDAGWSTTDIVTLSQLVAFLSFQIRVVAGLRALDTHSLNAA